MAERQFTAEDLRIRADLLADFYTGTDAGGAYWHITRSTEESPRERKHFKVTDARELLKKIAAQV